jgi:steroid delta-isomerase-like uncharacterized protein
MTRDEIVAFFDRWQDAFERRDVATLASLYAETCIVESPTAGGTVTGSASVAHVYDAWFRAFPDLMLTDSELLIDGDRVARVATTIGTDTGGFMGIPATGKPFRLPIVFLCTLSGGRITAERRIYDFTGLLVQVGVLRAKPA